MALLMIGARMVDFGQGRRKSHPSGTIVQVDPWAGCDDTDFPGHADGRNRDGVRSVCSADGHECVYYDQGMGGDDGLAANAILASVPCSVVIMTIGIYLMRITGIV